MREDLFHKELTKSIIGAFYEVYNKLGFGFVEKNYVKALYRELRWRGHRVAREEVAEVFYKGWELGTHRLDMVVDETVIVEVKSTKNLAESADRQLTNYLRATKYEIGLLLHFGEEPKFYRRVMFNKNKMGFRRLSAPDPRDPGSRTGEAENLRQPNSMAASGTAPSSEETPPAPQ